VADLSSYEPLTAPSTDAAAADRARLLVAGLNRLGLAATAEPGADLHRHETDDARSRRGANMTECVSVPSSEHVAEIVGRQGRSTLH